MRLSRFYLSTARSDLRKRAFSLIELMVAVSLTTFIIIVLYQVFNQTQKALRSSLKQVNVQELGAPAMELLTAELQSALAFTPFDPSGTNVEIRSFELNPMVQVDSSNNIIRTNVIQTLWFLRKDKQMWIPTMYRFMETLNGTNDPGMPQLHVGTLARFTTNFHSSTMLQRNDLLAHFYTRERSPKLLPSHLWPRSHMSRVAERVVHFKVTPFDAAGRPYSFNAPTNYATRTSNDRDYRYYSADSTGFSSNVVVRADTRQQVSGSASTTIDEVWFSGRAMPAAIEVEIGIVEQETYDQYRLMASDGGGRHVNFLRTRPHAVHVFRKRIPVVSGLRDERLVVTK